MEKCFKNRLQDVVTLRRIFFLLLRLSVAHFKSHFFRQERIPHRIFYSLFSQLTIFALRKKIRSGAQSWVLALLAIYHKINKIRWVIDSEIRNEAIKYIVPYKLQNIHSVFSFVILKQREKQVTFCTCHNKTKGKRSSPFYNYFMRNYFNTY